MGLICFDKPKKVRSTEDHNIGCSSDCGIPGTYVSNMSHKDRAKWKGKVVGTRRGKPQIEIRKDGFVIVVGLGGYKYKYYDTTEKNIHISASGPIIMTFEDWEKMRQVVEEAKEILKDIK